MTSTASPPVRLISRLDIKGENLIKGLRFEGLRVVGLPNERAVKYYQEGADEILYIDAVASLYDQKHLANLAAAASKDVFVPITVAGGIRSVDDVRLLLRSGADKVAINTAAVKFPKLISQVAEAFGSQCIVLSIEAKRVSDLNWEVFVESGREPTGLQVLDWLEEGIAMGAGEILVTSVDKDGLEQGADIDLVTLISERSSVPVIASGGIGTHLHAVEVFENTKADAIAIGSALHYERLSLPSLRQDLIDRGFGVRRHI